MSTINDNLPDRVYVGDKHGPYILASTTVECHRGTVVSFGEPTAADGCYWPAIGIGGISFAIALAMAKRIELCWNTHNELVAELEIARASIFQHISGGSPDFDDTISRISEAIDYEE